MACRHVVSMLGLVTLPLLATAAEAPVPPPGMLEYLGGMVHEDGEWMDPLELLDAESLGVDIPAASRGDAEARPEEQTTEEAP